MKTFAYIRVSSKEQNEARQVETMMNLGINERDMFIDKMSGKSFDRPSYKLLKQMVREGDVVVFDSITRMGRNMNDTMNEYNWFVENGVQLQFVKEPMINTTNEQDDLMKEAIRKIVLVLLTAFAEKERDEIKIRQAEGIAVAKAQGKHLGRPKTSITNEFENAYKQWKEGNLTGVQAMEQAKLKKATWYRKVKEYESSRKYR
ncbi:integrase [Bacillus sp. AFS001701]|uniref:recombinase family protein n=1 Tax=Bacillus sp. AFS001701 TaxID=2033480 RepID=UPI000BF95FBE|nr:recombinase family protein [Bacillus sp. AFS001701]PET65155.1 integrase [Bacillus sp. AFS001701]